MSMRNQVKRWAMLVAVAVLVGAGVAQAAEWCTDCEPCTCEPDGSYGLCCGPAYPC